MCPVRLLPGGQIYVAVFPVHFNVRIMFSKKSNVQDRRLLDS